MALGIDGATIGFDTNGIQDLLNEINVNCIQTAISTLNGGLDQLRTDVDSAWVGKSAEVFKKNMETDKNAVVDGLNEMYDSLAAELHDIANRMGQADEELLQER